MKYLLATALSVYFVTGLALTDFNKLQDLEGAYIFAQLDQANDSVAQQVSQLAQDQQEVILNYLYIATLSAHAERIFVKQYVEFQHSLARMKSADAWTKEDASGPAKDFALLNRITQEKIGLSTVLKHIEVHMDADEGYAYSITCLRDTLTGIMSSLLEGRRQVIDTVLWESNNRLADGTFGLLAKFCKILVEEPELLVREDAIALSRVDTMYNIARQVEGKIASVDEIKQALDEIVYFTLLITQCYFKECYTKLRQNYCDSYDEEPRSLFGFFGALSEEQIYTLPEKLLA